MVDRSFLSYSLVFKYATLFYCWQIFTRSLTDCWYTVADNNQSSRLKTLHVSHYQQHLSRTIHCGLMLSMVRSCRALRPRRSTIFTSISRLRTTAKILALLYIPSYNAVTTLDVHAVELSIILSGLS